MIPKISSDIGSYGIYTVVTSVFVFLSYADLGFLGAGQKFAAEKYALGNEKLEIEILSFAHFILLCALIIYVGFLIFIYFNPSILFNELANRDLSLVKNFILIFICSSPLILFQRYFAAILAIRIEEYFYQGVIICGNVINILSTFYFFREGHYEIINYVVFMQLISFFSLIIIYFIIRKRYSYNFKLVLTSLKFNSNVFALTKKMALTSILTSISWILYYESDPLYVSKLYDPKTVGLFAVGLTMLTLTRTIMSAFFAPFQTKFNHLRGLGRESEMNIYFSKLVELSIPLSIIFPVGLIILMEPIIYSWVGSDFIQSIIIAKILISGLFFSFITGPLNLIAIAKEKYRFLLVSSLSLPFLYGVFYLLLNLQFGMISLPLAKIMTLFCSLVINLYYFHKIISFPLMNLLLRIFIQLIGPLFMLLTLLYITTNLWNVGSEKSFISLVKVVIIGGLIIIFSSFMFYLINPNTRQVLHHLIKNKLGPLLSKLKLL